MTKFHAASGLRGLSLTNCSFPYSIHVQTFSCNMQIYTYLHSSTKFRCHVVNKKITPTQKIVRNLHYIQQRFKRSCANKKPPKNQNKKQDKKKDWLMAGRPDKSRILTKCRFLFLFYFLYLQRHVRVFTKIYPYFFLFEFYVNGGTCIFFSSFFYDSKAFHGVGPRRFQVNPILSMVILYQLSETTRAIFD